MRRPRDASTANYLQGIALGELAIGAAWSSTLLAVLWGLFEPRWWTNDDVVMSMRAHGYGVAEEGVPQLLFSNALWGGLVRLLPDFPTAHGYSIATAGMLVLVGTVVHSSVRIVTGRRSLGLLAVPVVLVIPMLHPQFTVVSGLLVASGIAALQVHRERSTLSSLHAAIALILLGLLVRDTETLLLLLIALPVVPWRIILERPARWISVIVGACLAVALVLVDRLAYANEEWARWQSWNAVRLPFTDYGLDQAALARPELLDATGVTANDVRLIRSWFFADPEVADAERFGRLATELSAGPIPPLDPAGAVESFSLVVHPWVMTTVLVAAVLLLLRADSRILLSWLLTAAAIAGTGLFGRPGVERVFLPAFALLVLVALLRSGAASGWRVPTVLAVAAGLLVIPAIDHLEAARDTEAKWSRNLHAIDGTLVVGWGNSFPSEALYPVVGKSLLPDSVQVYGLDSTTLAPGTVHSVLLEHGAAFRDLILSDEGLQMFADERKISLIGGYCRDYLGAEAEAKYLAGVRDTSGGGDELWHVRCTRYPDE